VIQRWTRHWKGADDLGLSRTALNTAP